MGYGRLQYWSRLRALRLISHEQFYQGTKYTLEQMQSFNPPRLFQPPEMRHMDFTEQTTHMLKTAPKGKVWPGRDPSNPKMPDWQYDYTERPGVDPPFPGAEKLYGVVEDVEGPPPVSKARARADAAKAAGKGETKQEEGPTSTGFSQAMTMEEAASILGLTSQKDRADKKLINSRFRALMLKNHPDIGGSAYVAFKVNEAKEILMGEKAAAGGPERTPEQEQQQQQSEEGEIELDDDGRPITKEEKELEELENLTEEWDTTPKAKKSKPKPTASAEAPQQEEASPDERRKRAAAEMRRQMEEKLKKMRDAKDQELAEFVEKLKKQGVKAFADEPKAEQTQEETKKEPEAPKQSKKKHKSKSR